MKIIRHGAAAYHGESSIDLANPKFGWDKLSNNITIKKTGVKDFSTKSRHSYTTQLSVPEVASLLQALADAAMANPERFEKELEPSLKALLQLQTVAIGIKSNNSIQGTASKLASPDLKR